MVLYMDIYPCTSINIYGCILLLAHIRLKNVDHCSALVYHSIIGWDEMNGGSSLANDLF